MLNVLYEIFIVPFQWLLAFIYDVSYTFTFSIGNSIFLTSIVINLILLPIHFKIYQWQEEDRNKKAELSSKLQMIKKSFTGQLRFMMIRTLYRQANYSFFYNLRNSLGFLAQIPFFIAAYSFFSFGSSLQGESFLFITNLLQPDELINNKLFSLNILPIIMTLISICSTYIYTKNLDNSTKIQLYILPLCFFILLYNAPSGLLLYWITNNVCSLLINCYLRRKIIINKQCSREYYQQVIVLNLSTLIFITVVVLYFPIYLILNDTMNEFDINLSNIIIFWLQLTILGLMFNGLVALTSGRLLVCIYFFAVYLSLFSVVAITYNIFDTCSIDGGVISNIALLDNIWVIIFDILFIFALYFILKINFKFIFSSMFLILFSVIILSIYNAQSFKYFDIKSSNYEENSFNFIGSLGAFSKNKENIIIFMLDSFNNQHVEELIRLDPSFREKLRGFVWYMNTLAVGQNTYLSYASIHGGEKFTPPSINSRSKSIISIEDEIARSYQSIINSFSTQGFSVALSGVQYVGCDHINKYAVPDYCSELNTPQNEILAAYLRKHPELDLSNDRQNKGSLLLMIGLYNAVPYSLRKFIYDDGNWLGVMGKNNLIAPNSMLQEYAKMDLFFENSYVDDSLGPTLKYIGTHYTHRPWLHKSDCGFIQDSIFDTGIRDRIDNRQLSTEKCLLLKISTWIEWLKAEDIFDNTMIVLVSDHDRGYDKKIAKAFGASYVAEKYPGAPSSLLLVKDFNNNREFAESSQFMSNSDVASIVCSQIGGCDGIEMYNPLMNPKNDRVLTHSIGEWHPSRHKKAKYKLERLFNVRGDMYKRDSWQQIDLEPQK